jgi:hypothetical protein
MNWILFSFFQKNNDICFIKDVVAKPYYLVTQNLTKFGQSLYLKIKNVSS